MKQINKERKIQHLPEKCLKYAEGVKKVGALSQHSSLKTTTEEDVSRCSSREE
jgi:hypothetical protein